MVDTDTLEAVKARLIHLRNGTGPYDGSSKEFDFSTLVVVKHRVRPMRKPRSNLNCSAAEVKALVQLMDDITYRRQVKMTPEIAKFAQKVRRAAARNGVRTAAARIKYAEQLSISTKQVCTSAAIGSMTSSSTGSSLRKSA